MDQAIELDPNYGAAWWLLAVTVQLKAASGLLDPTESLERVRQLAQHALQLSPDLARARATLAGLHLHPDWDWAAAEAESQRTLAIDPTDPTALDNAGLLSATLGRYDDSERQLRAALSRDPLNTHVLFHLGHTYYRAGRFAVAEAQRRKLLELAPGFLWARTGLGGLAQILLAEGKPEAPLAVVKQEPDEGMRLQLLPIVLQANGRKAEADEALRALTAQWADRGACSIAMNYAYRGDHDLALQWLDRAYEQREGALLSIVGEPLFKNLADDTRYKAFLRKMKLPE